MQANTTPTPRKSVAKHEQRYYGKRQCNELFNVRPQDIINVHLLKPLTKEYTTLLKWCAEHRKAYHYCSSDDLNQLAKSQHHEGIIILAKKRSLMNGEDFVARVENEKPQLIIHLDGVVNPHNLGAIIRSASFFGFRFFSMLQDAGSALPAASCRVAEGGAEHMHCGAINNSVAYLTELKRLGYQITVLENSARTDLSKLKTSQPTVIVFGAEDQGVAPATKKIATQEARVTGNGAISSLNVASAASIVLYHYACN